MFKIFSYCYYSLKNILYKCFLGIILFCALIWMWMITPFVWLHVTLQFYWEEYLKKSSDKDTEYLSGKNREKD